MAKKTFIVFVLGPPASGKGTLCKQLAANHKLFHLSVGDFLRALTNGRLADRADIVAPVKAGGTQGLVPGEVLVPLLVNKIREEMDRGESIFLLDGFPRDLEQDSTFKAKMQVEFGSDSTPDLTISISCTRDTAKTRYLGRNRVDDSPELFEQRYSDYEQRDRRVVELHRENSVKFEADASPTTEEAYIALLKVLACSSAWRAMTGHC